ERVARGVGDRSVARTVYDCIARVLERRRIARAARVLVRRRRRVAAAAARRNPSASECAAREKNTPHEPGERYLGTPSAPPARSRFHEAFSSGTFDDASNHRRLPMNEAETLFGDEHVRRYRETGGKVGHIWRNGSTILLLTTAGRKTGTKHTIPLIYATD